MKVSLFAAAGAVAVATVLSASAASAQTFSAPAFYGNIGYSAVDADNVTLGAIHARGSARIHPNFGVEAEAAFGVKDDSYRVGTTTLKTDLKHELAAYGVGYLPINPNLDLLARVGYGTSKYGFKAGTASASDHDESWNYGVGAQYLFDGVNGVRLDYTRYDFDNSAFDANVWSASYVRKF